MRDGVEHDVKAARIGEQRGDVAKQHAGLGEIRDVADQAAHVRHGVELGGDRDLVELRPAGRVYVILGSQSLEAVQDELASLRRILLWSVPIALGLAAVGGWSLARRSLSPGVSPGFLVAVAGLLDETIASVKQGSESPDRRSVAYVFGSRIYDLRVVSAERTTTAYDGRAISTVRTRFEIRTSGTGARSRFELTAGAAEDLVGVPLTIEWQPHWWLRVKLRLVGPADAAAGL